MILISVDMYFKYTIFTHFLPHTSPGKSLVKKVRVRNIIWKLPIGVFKHKTFVLIDQMIF